MREGDRMSILIVDDNLINLKLIRTVLSLEGYSVISAINAEEAIHVLNTYRPALILMDIQLPGMDGLELTKRIKANPDLKDILIVAVTAYAMKGDEEKVRAAGCDGYITKPINTRTLPSMVAALLSQVGD